MEIPRENESSKCFHNVTIVITHTGSMEIPRQNESPKCHKLSRMCKPLVAPYAPRLIPHTGAMERPRQNESPSGDHWSPEHYALQVKPSADSEWESDPE